MINMEKFSFAADSIDQDRIPQFLLSDGNKMPCIGYGTFGSDHVEPGVIAENVKVALSLGYRLLDCAPAYENEKEIGVALKEVFETGLLRREDLFIISKLPNNRHNERDVRAACAETLRYLQVNYLDLYLIHWPFPNYHTPGCDTHQRDPNARPFFEEEYLMVWRQMEKLVEMGLVKSIGMSNMNIPKIESVWQEMKIKPVVNECELHPHLRQDELIAYLKEKNVLPIAHTPLGSPHRPERDRTTEDTNCLQDPAILEIAQAHGIHPVSVVLKWAVQRGTLPVPFSISRSHILSNLQCCTEDLLTNAEMEKINNIGTQCRLIKGTVLLWEGAPDWHCLWDEQGEIDRTGWKG